MSTKAETIFAIIGCIVLSVMSFSIGQARPECPVWFWAIYLIIGHAVVYGILYLIGKVFK